jgi:hypothetical protein
LSESWCKYVYCARRQLRSQPKWKGVVNAAKKTAE